VKSVKEELVSHIIFEVGKKGIDELRRGRTVSSLSPSHWLLLAGLHSCGHGQCEGHRLHLEIQIENFCVSF